MPPEAIDVLSIPPVTYWDTYASRIVETAIYPGSRTITGLVYVTLGLCGESGEFCDQAKKVIRDDGNVLLPERRVKLCKELGDGLWYMGGIAREIGVSLSECLMAPPPDWITTRLVGIGTPTALVQAAMRLSRASGDAAEWVDSMLVEGGVMDNDDVEALRRRASGFYYAANLCAQQLNMDLREVGEANIMKLLDRKTRGVLGGSGNDR